MSTQPPAPPPGYPPPQPYYYPVYDPKELYYPGQDDEPGYLHKPGRDNPQAITGFSFSISALGLFVLSSGLAFVIAIPMSIVGIVVGRRGVRYADSAPAVRHRTYARAGFVVGIVTLVLATLAGLLFIAAAIFPDAFDDNTTDGGVIGLTVRLAAHALGL